MSKRFEFYEALYCYPTYGDVIDTATNDVEDFDMPGINRRVGGTDLEMVANVRLMRYRMYSLDPEQLEFVIDLFPFANPETVRKLYVMVQLDKIHQEEEFQKAIAEVIGDLVEE